MAGKNPQQPIRGTFESRLLARDSKSVSRRRASGVMQRSREGRDPLCSVSVAEKWIPACAGMTTGVALLERQRLAGQILGTFDRDQHGVALLVRVALFFRWDQAPPHLVVDRAGFVDLGGAVEAGDAAARQHSLLAQ